MLSTVVLFAAIASVSAGICPSGSPTVTKVEEHYTTDKALTSETLITAKFQVTCGGSAAKDLSLVATLGDQSTAVASDGEGNYQVSLFWPHGNAPRGYSTVTLSATDDSGDSTTLSVYSSGASSTELPVSTELIVLGIVSYAVTVAANMS
eukprot:m.231713 g.231713  ORF g.231713 m.231713 type:complete len:150 (+) comp15700_c1_seq1:367-816(+)